MAESLENAVARAQDRRVQFTAAVPISREAAGEARAALLDLAERLRAPRHVSPDGVQRVGSLLVDGTGPLYWPDGRGELRAATLAALAALDGHGPNH
jgi:hypothetical protein